MTLLTRLIPGVLAAAIASGPAAAAPFAVLWADPDVLGVVDLASPTPAGAFVRYDTVLVRTSEPTPVPGLPDEMRYAKEADCAGKRTRILSRVDFLEGRRAAVQLFEHPEPEQSDWTEVDPAELRMACARDPGAGTVLPDAAAVRATFNAYSKGKAPTPKQASTMR